MDARKIVNFIDRGKIPIILIWVIFALMLSSFYAPNFMDATKSEYEPPKGSDTAEAVDLVNQYFPDLSEEESHIVVIYDPTGQVISPELASFTGSLVSFVQASFPDELMQMTGYFIMDGTELDPFKYEYVSEDLTTSIISFTFKADVSHQEEIAKKLRSAVKDNKPSNFKAYLTGGPALSMDTDHSIERDMALIDTIVIPLVFIVLLFLLRNWKYFPLTLAPIVMTIGLSFALLERYIAFTGATVMSFVPSVLISLVLGISVDYSLFLLSRFREERKKGNNVKDSVTIMMARAGHTVFTSGMTLTISIAGLTLFPVAILSSVGIAISIGVFVLLAINLTFTPAILLLIGGWIEKDEKDEKENLVESQSNSVQERGLWYRIAKIATKYNWGILLVILLLTVPIAAQMLQIEADSETAFFAPIDSDSDKGFEHLQKSFSPGIIGPVNVIVVPTTETVWSESSFNAIHLFIQQSIDQTILDSSSFSSHAWLNGSMIPYELANAFIDPASPFYNTQDGQLYRLYGSQFVSTAANQESKAALIQIVLPVDPESPEAKEVLRTMKGIADETFANSFSHGFTGNTATSAATISETYEIFPIMIVLVIIIIYGFVGVMFRAAVLPARLIATIGLTIAFIYGAATIVFEYTTFLNEIFPVLDEVTVIFWMVPVMATSIIIGLGLDYDIFTVERIKENVWKGLDNKEAIAQGIDKTGRIITGAGIIMMIAFGGLMFSSSIILVQFGFILTFAVFLDTFVVRTILVPAIMGFGEKWNWWPSHPPSYEKDSKQVAKTVVGTTTISSTPQLD